MLEDAALGCPENYENLISRVWNGTHDICLEKKANDLDINVRVDGSEGTGEACQGIVEPGRPAINMTTIGGMIICAKRGGDPLYRFGSGRTEVNNNRILYRSLKCPDGTERCSNFT